ncbi:hypothetical protein AVL48_29380 [Amycolatopsis regifaucium]|uniref:Uncharacterized protein n=1 Tax=Amycolatopsis regifaucium TaxID=546365 RepID=A0A154MPP4_9PSEU|nr:hypothetical protein AVL48_29380 [Amycolatopsis regifaucium]OKA05164.1 hypothetical protein ATP06_0229475 [Amycolatopsis regifaucium]
MPRDATRTVLSPETHLALLSSVLSAPHPGHAENTLLVDEARHPAGRGSAYVYAEVRDVREQSMAYQLTTACSIFSTVLDV